MKKFSEHLVEGKRTAKEEFEDLSSDILLLGTGKNDNIKYRINEYIKNFIIESQKLNAHIEKSVKKYEKDYKKKVSRQDLLRIVREHLKGTVWGDDKMLPLISEVIALGNYVH